MRYKIKLRCLLIIILVFSLLLAGCSKGSPAINNGKEGKKERPDLLSKKDEGKDQEGLGDGTKYQWADADGLIKIWKEEDKYYIYYEEEKWEEKYKIEKIIKAEYQGGSFASRKLELWGLEEEVRDVAIVSIDGYGGSHGLKNDYPLVFMLMESGGVTWMHGYPPVDEFYEYGGEFKRDEQYVYGYLPYIKDIEGFSYESDGEGMGEMTLFAIDREGLRYDVRNLINYEALLYGNWITAPAYNHGGEFDYIYLNFSGDGSAKMYRVKDKRAIEIYYEGTYHMHLDDSSSKGYRSPSVSLDLKIVDRTPRNYQVVQTLKGTFMLDLADDYIINFYWMDGDSLEEGTDIFKFMLNEHEDELDGTNGSFNVWHMTDEELIDYSLEVVVGLRDKVEKGGMSLIVGGDSIELNDYGYCRNLSLGTNHQGSFVREIHYTVTANGIVFEFNPIDDLWYIIYNPND